MTKKTGFNDLLRAIYGEPEYVKPPIGTPPAFVTAHNNSKTYTCAICGLPIEDEGLLVKIRKLDGTFLHAVPIHMGECDDKLVEIGRRESFNTNLSMELSFFDNDDDREAYLNNDYSMSDSEFLS